MSTLIIAEKPLVAKAIIDALPGTGTMKTSKFGVRYTEKGGYVITSAAGHILKLKEPEDYDAALKKWTRESLPIFFAQWGMKPAPDKVDLVNTIGELLSGANEVIHAGDVDDEGQRLIDEILEYFRFSGPVKRLRTSDLSVAAMKKALMTLEDNSLWMPSGVAAYARSVGDMIVGVNASRFFSLLYQARLPVGRVQTPTLGLVVARENAINAHVKQKYYELFAQLEVDGHYPDAITARFSPAKDNAALDEEGHIRDKASLEAVLRYFKGKSLPCEIKTKKEYEAAPLPFNLNKLNLYCSAKWGYDPQRVMDITQSLREKHRAITYNRSDSQYLTDEQHAEAPAVLRCCMENLGIHLTSQDGFDPKLKSRCFDNTKVTAHTAIIPTETQISLNALTQEERNVYTAICLYYISQFVALCEKKRTRLEMDLGKGNQLVASSVVIERKGYRTLLETATESPTHLSSIPDGRYQAKIADGTIEERETKPLRHYTKATLAEDMSRVAKYVDDTEVKRILLEKDAGKEGESGSIGTSATRARIIEALIEHGYLSESGKNLFVTQKGQDFYKVLPEELRTVDMTAKWWLLQEDIRSEKATPQDLFDNVLTTINRILSTYKKDGAIASEGSNRESLGKCPLCGSPVYEGQKSFYCSGYKAGCKFSLWKTGKYGVHQIMEASKKKLTAPMVKQMLGPKGQALVKGLMSKKTGKKYDAYLGIEQSGDYTNLKINGFPQKNKK